MPRSAFEGAKGSGPGVIGPYRIQARLGQGGMGTVFSALDPRGRRVAIKVLREADPAFLLRFERERRLLTQLSQTEGFVSILDAGASDQGPYLALELMTGGSLRDELRHAPLPIPQVLVMLRAMARAAGRAHDQGIVHRDLKPENILLDEDGAPHIADLGLAKHFQKQVVGAEHTASLTARGELMGTPRYMAPEQISDAKSAGPEADVYALGVMTYEALTGQAPFDGANPVELLMQVVKGRWTPVEALRPDCPPPLAAIVERCLASDPSRRFPDGLVLAEAVDTMEQSPPPRRLAALLIAAPVVLGLVLGAAALWPKAPTAPIASPPSAPSPIASPPSDPSPSAPSPSALRTAASLLVKGGVERPPLVYPPLPHDEIASAPRTLAEGRLRLTGLKLEGEPHAPPILSFGLSEDGRLLAVVSWSEGDSSSAGLWELPSGRRLADDIRFPGVPGEVAFSPDGERVAFTSGRFPKVESDGIRGLLDLRRRDGSKIKQVEFSDEPETLAFNSGGQLLVAVFGGLRLFDARGADLGRGAAGSKSLHSLAWSEADRVWLILGSNGIRWRWAPGKGSRSLWPALESPELNRGHARDAAGRVYFVRQRVPKIWRYDPKTGIDELFHETRSTPSRLTVSADGTRAAWLDSGGELGLMIGPGRVVYEPSAAVSSDKACALALTPDGRYLFLVTGAGQVLCYSIRGE